MTEQAPLEVRDAIESVWPRLTGRQRFVLRGLFWHGLTLEEVGRALGMTKEGVRQIKVRALQKARRLLGSRQE
jgi:RNA polymerase sigma factor (sigma-70 family)